MLRICPTSWAAILAKNATDEPVSDAKPDEYLPKHIIPIVAMPRVPPFNLIPLCNATK